MSAQDQLQASRAGSALKGHDEPGAVAEAHKSVLVSSGPVGAQLSVSQGKVKRVVEEALPSALMQAVIRCSPLILLIN